MSAATRLRQVRRVGTAGPELRPETQWERIGYPGGVYTARRVPQVELLLVDPASASSFAGAVLVLDTHDLALAAELAWPVWADQQGGARLSAPTRGWWRQVLADDVVAGAEFTGRGYDSLWWPVRPGTPGTRPGVEFAFPTRGRGDRR